MHPVSIHNGRMEFAFEELKNKKKFRLQQCEGGKMFHTCSWYEHWNSRNFKESSHPNNSMVL